MNPELHDFRRPTRLPADGRNRLTAWCRLALELASKSWLKQLPVALAAAVQDLDVYFAHQVLKDLTETTLGYRVQVGGTPALLLAPRNLILNLVGVLLGDSAGSKDRELTTVEEKLADYFLANHWLTFFREAWPGQTQVPWVLDGREPNLQTARIYAKDDVLIVLHWQITAPFGEGKGALCFQNQGLLGLLGLQDTGRDRLPDAQLAVRRETLVQQLPVTLEFVLGSVELKLCDLASLQVGDVVLLDQRCADGVIARSGGHDLLQAKTGRVGSRKAIQVSSYIHK